jgi:hypothetical protein
MESEPVFPRSRGFDALYGLELIEYHEDLVLAGSFSETSSASRSASPTAGCSQRLPSRSRRSAPPPS